MQPQVCICVVLWLKDCLGERGSFNMGKHGERERGKTVKTRKLNVFFGKYQIGWAINRHTDTSILLKYCGLSAKQQMSLTFSILKSLRENSVEVGSARQGHPSDPIGWLLDCVYAVSL